MFRRLSLVLAVLSPLLFASSTQITPEAPIRRRVFTAPSQFQYTFFHLMRSGEMSFVTERPSAGDPNLFLCVPAAFTQLKSGTVDGLTIVGGQVIEKEINPTLNGIAYRGQNGWEILSTAAGERGEQVLKQFQNKTLSPSTLFQQVLLIHNNKVVKHPSTDKHFRRAMCLMPGGRVVISESHIPMTYNKFARDLLALNVEYAIYLDMGAWDEGWFRNPTHMRLERLGQDRSATDRQSNWLVFRKVPNLNGGQRY